MFEFVYNVTLGLRDMIYNISTEKGSSLDLFINPETEIYENFVYIDTYKYVL